MTAEIAVMNREAIALASDSAVTMMGEADQKIFTSANKLFALSKYHPVGIMVYGSATLMAVPWETIIKTYRNGVGRKRYDTLEEHADAFIQFLDNGNPLFPDYVQEDYVRSTIYSYLDFIKKAIKEKVHSVIDKKGSIAEEMTKQIISETITGQYEDWERAENIPSIPKNYNRNIANKYGDIIDKAIEEIFEKVPLSKGQLKELRKIAGSLFSKFPENIERENTSGAVIAGFGYKDTFPSLEAFDIEGIANNRLKYNQYTSARIDFETSASIIPFARGEMVATFMEGVDPTYRDVEESYLSEVLRRYAEIILENIKGGNHRQNRKLKEKLTTMGTGILEDLKKKLEAHRNEIYTSPITRVVSMLPKDELAVMAETLVSLTSFKLKVTMESETVGGPIDVAVISKGDGFIWIKRKHYFQSELNPQFFATYYEEELNE